MPADAELLNAVHLAVETAPRNLTLRLHLGYLLLEAGRPVEALEQCALVLVRVPDHRQALDLATRAAVADAHRVLEVLPRPARPSRSARAIAAPSRRGPAPVRGPALGCRVEWPGVRFDSVGGMTSVKRQLGRSRRATSLLLYGPPGCGKTFIARALAGELGAGFLAVEGAGVLDLWARYGRHALHEAFELARASAPCLLFLDGLDALSRAARDVSEQLLAELVGVGTDDGITVVAASERPWEIPSLLRGQGQGGLGPHLLVLPPDRMARQAIIRGALRGQPLDDLNLAALAGRTEYFSATDLIRLCDVAARMTLETAMARGVRPVGMGDFDRALRQVHPSPLAWYDLARASLQHAGEDEDEGEGVLDVDLRAYLRTVIPTAKGAA